MDMEDFHHVSFYFCYFSPAYFYHLVEFDLHLLPKKHFRWLSQFLWLFFVLVILKHWQILSRSFEIDPLNLVSNLSSKPTKTFSTTLLSSNYSPIDLILFIIVKSLLEYALMFSVFFILRSSNSRIRVKSFICLILLLLWKAILRVSQAFFAISQTIIFVNTAPITTEWIHVMVFDLFLTTSLWGLSSMQSLDLSIV